MWGLLWWSQITTKVVVWLWSAAAGQYLALQLCLEVSGTHNKIAKNKVRVGFNNSAKGQYTQEISPPSSKHKNHIKSCKFGKIWDVQTLTFSIELTNWLLWTSKELNWLNKLWYAIIMLIISKPTTCELKMRFLNQKIHTDHWYEMLRVILTFCVNTYGFYGPNQLY